MGRGATRRCRWCRLQVDAWRQVRGSAQQFRRVVSHSGEMDVLISSLFTLIGKESYSMLARIKSVTLYWKIHFQYILLMMLHYSII